MSLSHIFSQWGKINLDKDLTVTIATIDELKRAALRVV
jgi:hypothetical protein